CNIVPGYSDADIANRQFDEVGEDAVRQGKGLARPPPGDDTDGTTRHASRRECHHAIVTAELYGVGQQVIDDLLGFAYIELDHADALVHLELETDTLAHGRLFDDRQTA